MKGVRVGGAAREDLDDELFQIVQKTARHFANDIERLGRRYRRLRAAVDLGGLRRKTEDSLMGLVDGRTPVSRRKRNNGLFSKRRMSVTDWLELTGGEACLKIVRVMPHDEGDFEVLLPDDPDPQEVTRTPSPWRWLTHSLFGR